VTGLSMSLWTLNPAP